MNRQPVVIGVGEIADPLCDNLTDNKTIVELMAGAAQAALDDTGLPPDVLGKTIDTIAVVRTFSDSSPVYQNNFGAIGNYPRAIARRIGCNPDHAIYTPAGGNVPQQLVNEFSEKIARGELEAVLLVGGEALATAKAAGKSGSALDWSDDTGGQLEDRGIGVAGLIDWQQMENQLTQPPPVYALLENARRAGLGMSFEEYARQAGDLFARFAEVAATHPLSLHRESPTTEAIATAGEDNHYIAYPYTKHMVAKDGVNQSAAVLLTSAEKALELGVEAGKLVYPVTGCHVAEAPVIKRSDLSCSVAMRLAYETLFATSELAVADIDLFDLYSCFPIAVFSACEALGISADDPRPLTLTGGLPFFGGPGNNYSMHGIVNAVTALRAGRGDRALVGANGGYLSKHALGIYARELPVSGWQLCDNRLLQARADESPSEPVEASPEGEATLETYSVEFRRGKPTRAFAVCRTLTGKRFFAHTEKGDEDTLTEILAEDAIGKTVHVTCLGPGTRFTFDREKTRQLIPKRPRTLEGDYQFCKIQRHGHVLEITLNRPEVRNSLSSPAHYELDGIFDLYEKDNSLWVAIITGAGDEAFCAGNDLKATAAGEPMWLPPGGFGGITARKHRNKPLIAAVNGFAMGGGMEIAMACDLVVAAENATFALPEVKVGLIAAAGGIPRLTRQAPLKQAMEMLLLGKRISAAEALEMGLINRVVATGEALTGARQLAEQLQEVSPTSVSCTLELLSETEGFADTVDAVRHPSEALNRLITSKDMQEGVMAFVQKRKPEWTGT